MPDAGPQDTATDKGMVRVPRDPHAAAAVIRREFTPSQVAELVRLLHWGNV